MKIVQLMTLALVISCTPSQGDEKASGGGSSFGLFGVKIGDDAKSYGLDGSGLEEKPFFEKHRFGEGLRNGQIVNVPKPIAFLESYKIGISRKNRVVTISGHSNKVKCKGRDVPPEVIALKTLLAEKYGEPKVDNPSYGGTNYEWKLKNQPPKSITIMCGSSNELLSSENNVSVFISDYQVNIDDDKAAERDGASSERSKIDPGSI